MGTEKNSKVLKMMYVRGLYSLINGNLKYSSNPKYSSFKCLHYE